MASIIPQDSIDDKASDPKWKNVAKNVGKYVVAPIAAGTAVHLGYDELKDIALDYIGQADHVGGYVVATAERILDTYKPHVAIGTGVVTAGIMKGIDMYRNRKEK